MKASGGLLAGLFILGLAADSLGAASSKSGGETQVIFVVRGMQKAASGAT